MSFNSYQLKYIALITMMIDHGAVIFQDFLSTEIYYLLRGVGRLSFPIYCFLLVEGYFHTSDRFRYLIRLAIFAVISEIPFDLALNQTYVYMDSKNIQDLFYWSHQNVFFTLTFGLLSLILLESILYDQAHRLPSTIFLLIVIFACDYFCYDYGSAGILTIILFYLFRKNKKKEFHRLFVCFLPLLTLAIDAPIQLTCLFSILPIFYYNGEKGYGPKYIFYFAYPLHLVIFLAVLRRIS